MHPDLNPTESPDDGRDPAIVAQLRQLPSELRPPFDWAELQRRARAEGRSLAMPRTRLTTLIHAALAVAATLAIVTLATAAWLQRRGADQPQAPSLARQAAEPNGMVQQAATDARGLAPGSGDALASEPGEASERWLASLPPAPVVVHVGTRLAVTDLEDRIAAVDDLLTAARLERTRDPHLATLQRERGQLLDSLAQVRYAESLAAQVP